VLLALSRSCYARPDRGTQAAVAAMVVRVLSTEQGQRPQPAAGFGRFGSVLRVLRTQRSATPPAAEAFFLRTGTGHRQLQSIVAYGTYGTPLSVYFFLGVAAPLRCQRVDAIGATHTHSSEVNEKTI